MYLTTMDRSLALPHSIPEFKSRTQEFLTRLDKHEVFILVGSLTSTIALAVAPFIIIMISLVTLLNIGDQNVLIEQVRDLLGNDAGTVINTIVKNANQQTHIRGLSGILSFLILVISASAIFAQLRYAFDKMNEYQVESTESGAWSFVKQKVLCVGFVLAFVFLLNISLFVSAGLAATMPVGQGILLKTLNLLASFLVFTLLFALIFRWIPTRKISWWRSGVSAAVASVFFLIGRSLIGLYIGKAAVTSTYGAAGSLVALLIWLYYNSLALFLSYEFTDTFILESEEST